MPKKGIVVGVAAFAALLGTSASAQGVAGGPGCHLLMDQTACVACVKKNLPKVYDPQGSPKWCARMIAERRAKGLGREPLKTPGSAKDKKGGERTLTKSECISMCLARGTDRTRSSCEPWCAQGCRDAATGERYCVK
jgi:hypothetical protein